MKNAKPKTQKGAEFDNLAVSKGMGTKAKAKTLAAMMSASAGRNVPLYQAIDMAVDQAIERERAKGRAKRDGGQA